MSSLPAQTTNLDPTCAEAMLNAVRAALPPDPKANNDALQAQHWSATSMLGYLRPTNPLEAMFAAHAVVSHFAAMDASRRAADPAVSNDATHRLRGGARSLIRLCQSSVDLLHRQQSLKRGRVRTPDVLARAAAAAERKAPAMAGSETPAQTAAASDLRGRNAAENGVPAAAIPQPTPATPPRESAKSEADRQDPLHLSGQSTLGRFAADGQGVVADAGATGAGAIGTAEPRRPFPAATARPPMQPEAAGAPPRPTRNPPVTAPEMAESTLDRQHPMHLVRRRLSEPVSTGTHGAAPPTGIAWPEGLHAATSPAVLAKLSMQELLALTDALAAEQEAILAALADDPADRMRGSA